MQINVAWDRLESCLKFGEGVSLGTPDETLLAGEGRLLPASSSARLVAVLPSYFRNAPPKNNKKAGPKDGIVLAVGP